MEIVYLNWLLKRYNKTFILCNNREAGIYFTWAFYHDFIQKYFVYLQIVAQHLSFWKNMECKIYLQILREGDEKMLFLFHFFFWRKRAKELIYIFEQRGAWGPTGDYNYFCFIVQTIFYITLLFLYTSQVKLKNLWTGVGSSYGSGKEHPKPKL